MVAQVFQSIEAQKSPAEGKDLSWKTGGVSQSIARELVSKPHSREEQKLLQHD